MSNASKSDFSVLWTSLVSGALSGVVGVSTTYPLELIRVRLQVQQKHDMYTSFVDCFRKVVKGEGVRGLFKGLSAPLVGSTLTKTIDFGLFGLFSSWGKPGELSNVVVAGTCSAAVASFVLTPIDRAKIILQIQRSATERARAEGRAVSAAERSFEPLLRGPRDVWRSQGWTGMWRGQTATLMREIVYGALYFPMFALLKRELSERTGQPQLPFVGLMACGSTTGAVVWTAMFPLDVVKSKIQANRGAPISMFSVASSHYHAEGVRGFYKGLSAAIIRSLPAHGIVLATFSFLREVFDSQT